MKRVNPLQMPSFVRFSETGLTISSPRLCGITDWCKDGVRHVVLLYRADRFTGSLRDSDEGPVFWIDRSEIPGRRTVPDFMQILRLMDDDSLSEMFYSGDELKYF